MILLAFLFLGEVAGRQRIAVTFAGFCGILIMLQPFGGGFDPNGIVAVAGAVFGGMVVISIKKLGTTEPTRRIIFYYAFYTTLFSAIPAYLYWIPPTWEEVPVLVLIGILGIMGSPVSLMASREIRSRTVRLYADRLFRNFWGPSVRRGSKLVEHRRRDFDRWQ